ncbi:MAG: hypothetical protein ING19_17490 [Azospirillum sp.]|nr:hypothetical protein [Azospirillum sp.]
MSATRNIAPTNYPIGKVKSVLEQRLEELHGTIETGERKPAPPPGDSILPYDSKLIRAISRGIARMRFKKAKKTPSVEIQARAEERVILADRMTKQAYDAAKSAADTARADLREIETAIRIVEALGLKGKTSIQVTGDLDWRSAVFALGYSARALIDVSNIPSWYPGESPFPRETEILEDGSFRGGLAIILETAKERYGDEGAVPSFMEAVFDRRGWGIAKLVTVKFTGFVLLHGNGRNLQIAAQRGKIGQFPCIWTAAPEDADIRAIHASALENPIS